jgi:photosystem II stability/assembly factor-like uncharacterized protein
MHTYDGGRSWQKLSVSIAYYGTSIATDTFIDGKVYLGNQRMYLPPTVRISTDHGYTFTEYAITLPPAYAGQWADVRITPDPKIENHLLAGLCMGDNPPGPGFIYASTDGGLTWSQQTTPEGINCILSDLVFDPNNANVVYAGSLGFGLLRSTDGGATWNLLAHQPASKAVFAMTIDPNDSLSIYTSPGNGAAPGAGIGVYATHDGGDTWVEMTGSHAPIWALQFCQVGAEHWLYAATMNGLQYLKMIPLDPSTPWEDASGIAGVATVDGFACESDHVGDARTVFYIGTSGGTLPSSAAASSQPSTISASQNFLGGIYRSMTRINLVYLPIVRR